jgi:hypothetical protein
MAHKGDIDSSHIPVDGAAGLGLVVMAGIVVYAVSPLRMAGLATALGGLAIGAALLGIRHRETRPAAIGGLVIAVVALLALGVATFVRHA